MLVLPALAALPAVRLKLTALAERPTVSDSGKVAVSAIGSALELSCAEATDDTPTSARTSKATRVRNLVAGFIEVSFYSFSIFLRNIDDKVEAGSPPILAVTISTSLFRPQTTEWPGPGC